VPQRNPFVALKQVTSLDFLSGGRIVMAVAAGWLEKEFQNLGSRFDGRGRVLDDWLELARSAFAQMPGAVDHDGGLPITGGWLAPGLVRPGGIELWVAGVSDATLRRAGRTGVWHPVALPPATLSELAVRFRQRRADGRVVLRLSTLFAGEPDRRCTDERERHAVTGPPQWIAERLSEYIDSGCDGFVVNLGHEAPGLEERVQRFAEEVWPLVARSSEHRRFTSTARGVGDAAVGSSGASVVRLSGSRDGAPASTLRAPSRAPNTSTNVTWSGQPTHPVRHECALATGLR
jgi:alkanesulfonate monooxygenase SsuD/methylene tetrahydromethanopterin reductase-like flavin-dependent oxidoreductase (luciferase family)